MEPILRICLTMAGVLVAYWTLAFAVGMAHEWFSHRKRMRRIARRREQNSRDFERYLALAHEKPRYRGHHLKASGVLIPLKPRWTRWPNSVYTLLSRDRCTEWATYTGDTPDG
jgi:hypothetical protein